MVTPLAISLFFKLTSRFNALCRTSVSALSADLHLRSMTVVLYPYHIRELVLPRELFMFWSPFHGYRGHAVCSI